MQVQLSMMYEENFQKYVTTLLIQDSPRLKRKDILNKQAALVQEIPQDTKEYL